MWKISNYCGLKGKNSTSGCEVMEQVNCSNLDFFFACKSVIVHYIKAVIDAHFERRS